MFTLFSIRQTIIVAVITLGIVGIVLNNDKSDILKKCRFGQTPVERLGCLRPFFGNSTQKYGAESALNRAKELQEEKIIDDCHLAAHFIGNFQYQKYRDSVGTAFATCSMGCTEGCFHGVMEAYVEDQDNIVPDGKIAKICDEIAEDKVLRRQCVHGIGHGFFRHNASFIEEALNSCDAFGDEANICQGGVFMENMNNYLLLDERDLIKKIPSICSDVEKIGNADFVKSCYIAVGEGFMFYTGHDLDRSRKLCAIVNESYTNVCENAAEMQKATNLRQL